MDDNKSRLGNNPRQRLWTTTRAGWGRIQSRGYGEPKAESMDKSKAEAMDEPKDKAMDDNKSRLGPNPRTRPEKKQGQNSIKAKAKHQGLPRAYKVRMCET
jgi:hypothetical protein